MAKKKPTTQKKIVLTVRITDKPEIEMMNELKKITGEKTYTGALMMAGRKYKSDQAAIKKGFEDHEKLYAELQKSEEVISVMHSANNILLSYGKKFSGKFPQRNLFARG